MANTHNKSSFTKFLDFFRNIVILILTGYVLYLLFGWHWLASIIGAIPIYIIIMNIIGFLTLPLYLLTPEKKLLRKTSDAMNSGDFEKMEELNNLFEEKFKN